MIDALLGFDQCGGERRAIGVLAVFGERLCQAIARCPRARSRAALAFGAEFHCFDQGTRIRRTRYRAREDSQRAHIEKSLDDRGLDLGNPDDARQADPIGRTYQLARDLVRDGLVLGIEENPLEAEMPGELDELRAEKAQMQAPRDPARVPWIFETGQTH